jgi:hypothetical protein
MTQSPVITGLLSFLGLANPCAARNRKRARLHAGYTGLSRTFEHPTAMFITSDVLRDGDI